MSTDHEGCLPELRAAWATVTAATHVEVTISEQPPLVRNHFTTPATCPHGTTYWIEPTADQRVKWNLERTP